MENGKPEQVQPSILIKVKDKNDNVFDLNFTCEEAFRLANELFRLAKLGPPRPVQMQGIPYPPNSVFRDGAPKPIQHLTRNPQPLFVIDRFEYPEEGGIYVYYKDIPYPRKGFPFPEGVQAANIAKRLLVGQIRYLKKNWLAAFSLLRRKNLQEWLREWNSTADIALGPYTLKRERYNQTCREIMKFLETFFNEIGIKEQTSSYAQSLATLLEYDDAYLLMLQDLANETSVELLLKNPIKELKRLFVILQKRDKREKIHILGKGVIFLFSILFLLPGVRRAFRKALGIINFTKIQMDEGDRYNALRWTTYDFFGEPFEVRKEKLEKIHDGKFPQGMMLQSVQPNA